MRVLLAQTCFAILVIGWIIIPAIIKLLSSASSLKNSKEKTDEKIGKEENKKSEKGKTLETPKTNKWDSFAKVFTAILVWLKTIIFLILLGMAGYWMYDHIAHPQKFANRQQKQTVTMKKQYPQPEKWKFYWEKLPDVKGKTSQRKKELPSVIEKTALSLIVIYPCGNEKGKMTGISTDGGTNYNGKWRDKTGWGKFHLMFTSPASAVGWMKDEENGPTANFWGKAD